MKYYTKLYKLSNKVEGDFEYIGIVQANTKTELKENTGVHARNWNKLGRIFIDEENTGYQTSVYTLFN
jgi:hypothetical protein